MTVTIDTSAWFEYFVGSKRGEAVKRLVESSETLLTPSIVLLEFKSKYIREKSEYQSRIDFIARRSTVVPLDAKLALLAADLREEKRLHTVDAVVYAAAMLNKSKLITGDNDFSGLANVDVIR